MLGRLLLFLRFQVFTAVAALQLFLAAGDWRLPWFWAYLVAMVVLTGLIAIRADLDLWRERAKPGGASEDNLLAIRLACGVLFTVQNLLAGWDAGRAHWTNFSPWVQGTAFFCFISSVGLIAWAQKTNRYFSSAMRIQEDRGHTVISSGPYAFVRHPGYLAFIITMISVPLALGSWVAMLPGLAGSGLFIVRCAKEDRMLKQKLDGYQEYAGRVRFRLAPGLW